MGSTRRIRVVSCRDVTIQVEIGLCLTCSNMTRQMPLWYVKEQNMFETMTREHPRIEVVRVPGGLVSDYEYYLFIYLI